MGQSGTEKINTAAKKLQQVNFNFEDPFQEPFSSGLLT